MGVLFGGEGLGAKICCGANLIINKYTFYTKILWALTVRYTFPCFSNFAQCCTCSPLIPTGKYFNAWVLFSPVRILVKKHIVPNLKKGESITHRENPY